jgi:hypothetical protein
MHSLRGAIWHALRVAIVAIVLFACAESAASAEPAYPPRPSCSLAAQVIGSGVSVVGTGYTPGSAVTLRLASGVIGQQRADAAGSFGFGLNLGGTAVGRQLITAGDGKCAARAPFTITNGPTTQPSGPPPSSEAAGVPSLHTGTGVFLLVLGAIAGAGVLLFLVASRAGHRGSR